MAEFVCRAVGTRGRTVISVGAESAHTAEGLARHAESCGATAVMAIPPISIAAGEEELLQYYRRLVTSIGIPVIVQDASSYVGRPVAVGALAALLDEHGAERILFKPEASPIGPRLTALPTRRADGRGCLKAAAASRWSIAFAAASWGPCRGPI